MKKKSLITMALFIMVAILGYCFYFPITIFLCQGQALGTSYTIKIAVSLSPKQQQHISENIQNILDDINNKMSTYLSNSEISLFNSYSGTDLFPISKKTMDVILMAQKVSEVTSGAFDITVGPLVNLWGFGRVKNSPYPTLEDLMRLMETIGYEKIIVHQKEQSLQKKHSDIAIDLSAIAKGFAVDEIADFLEQENILNYMVEVGGEIKVAGYNNKKKWTIGIETPQIETRGVSKILSVTNCAIATSGDYRNYRYFADNDERFSHTIDPQTGYPVKHRLASVTVITESCMYSDAMATAFMVLGDKGVELAEKLKLPCYFIFHTENGFAIQETNNFSQFVKDRKR